MRKIRKKIRQSKKPTKPTITVFSSIPAEYIGKRKKNPTAKNGVTKP